MKLTKRQVKAERARKLKVERARKLKAERDRWVVQWMLQEAQQADKALRRAQREVSGG